MQCRGMSFLISGLGFSKLHGTFANRGARVSGWDTINLSNQNIGRESKL